MHNDWILSGHKRDLEMQRRKWHIKTIMIITDATLMRNLHAKQMLHNTTSKVGLIIRLIN